MNGLRFVSLSCCVRISSAGIGRGEVLWQEDFESVACGQLPNGWVSGCGHSDYGVDCSASCDGERSLRGYGILGGCWASLIVSPIDPGLVYLDDFTVEFTMLNGSEGLSGCHPYRATLAMYKQVCWAPHASRGLLTVLADGSLRSSGGIVFGSVPLETCNTVRIRYTRPESETVRVQYWVDGDFLHGESLASVSYEDELVYFHWGAQEGTAWFDDIAVSQGHGVAAAFEPPITNDNFLLQDGTTVPIKFHLVDDTGDVIGEPWDVTLHVSGPDPDGVPVSYLFALVDGTLRFDEFADPPHYIATFHTRWYPVMDGGEYTATVHDSGMPIGSITFIVDATSGAGRGNR